MNLKSRIARQFFKQTTPPKKDGGDITIIRHYWNKMTKTCFKRQHRSFLRIKGYVHHKEFTLPNMYATNERPAKYFKLLKRRL